MTLSTESPGYPTRSFHGDFTVKVTGAQQWPRDAAECMEAGLVVWHSAHCTLAALIKKQADLILLFRGGFCFRWAEVHVGDSEMRSSSSIWWLKCCQLQDVKKNLCSATNRKTWCMQDLFINILCLVGFPSIWGLSRGVIIGDSNAYLCVFVSGYKMTENWGKSGKKDVFWLPCFVWINSVIVSFHSRIVHFFISDLGSRVNYLFVDGFFF